MWSGGPAVAARLARRDVLRRPGRTALVGLLVALPVAAMVLALVLFRTDQLSPLEQWVQEHGQADATAYGGGADPPALPEGSTSVTVRSAYVRAKTVDGERANLTVTDLPLMDPITVGKLELTEGRAPRSPGEVALSVASAEHFDVGIGEELRLERPARSYRVVGVVEQVTNLDQELLVVDREADFTSGFEEDDAVRLIDLPDELGLEELRMLPGQDGGLTVRDVVIADGWYSNASYGAADPVRWTYVFGAVVITVVGIVVAAAFAAGARRQLVTLGQLSANGASPGTLRLSLVLQGTVTGLLGGLAGLALAAAVLALGEVRIENAINHRVDGWEARPAELAVAVLFGVVAATLAALVPARTTARIPTLQAMAGRRPLSKVPRRLTIGRVRWPRPAGPGRARLGHGGTGPGVGLRRHPRRGVRAARRLRGGAGGRSSARAPVGPAPGERPPGGPQPGPSAHPHGGGHLGRVCGWRTGRVCRRPGARPRGARAERVRATRGRGDRHRVR
ncbi:MAG: hypothetical protein H0U89_10310, partial [Acidimicrobiia bacterium]|nr:hypothetical protein [Acidimicrobiia bacterium]